MANAVVTFFDEIGGWFASIFKKAPSWTVIAQTSINIAAIAFEGVTAVIDPSLAAVADPIISDIQVKLGTVANLVKNANATSAAGVLATVEADLSQLESVANISDPATKAKIAAIVATLNAVLAALPVSA
jgi:hypothetical protein